MSKIQTKSVAILLLPWLCWLTASSLYFYSFGLLALPSVLTTVYKEQLAFTTFEISMITTAFLYTYVAMQVPAGLLVDKYGARKVCIVAAMLLALGSLLFALTDNATVQLCSRLLMGLGGSATFVSTLLLARSWFAASLFPILVAVAEAMSGFGTIALPSIFSFLESIQAWEVVLIEIALIGFFLLALVLFFVRDTENKTGQQKSSVLAELKIVLMNWRVWLLVIYVACCFAHYAAFSNMWRVPWATAELHMNYQKAVLFNGIDVIGFVLGCVSVGVLSTRFTAQRVALVAGVTEVFMLLLLHSISYFLMQDPSNMTLLTMWTICLFILGLATGGILLSFELVKQVIPENVYGCCAGFINMAFGGIGILMIPLLSILMDNYQIKTATPVMILLNIITILGVISLAVFLKSLKKDRNLKASYNF